jgi:hypothetical protein
LQPQRSCSTLRRKTRTTTSPQHQQSLNAANGYVPPTNVCDGTVKTKKKKALWPKVGDIVRYYDLDGGKADGQVLVGRISFIQKKLLSKQEQATSITKDVWLLEISELDDVGDGYYADYPMRQRGYKKSMRAAVDVAPIAGRIFQHDLSQGWNYDSNDTRCPVCGRDIVTIRNITIQLCGEIETRDPKYKLGHHLGMRQRQTVQCNCHVAVSH